jgi:hypothetical protein
MKNFVEVRWRRFGKPKIYDLKSVPVHLFFTVLKQSRGCEIFLYGHFTAS